MKVNIGKGLEIDVDVNGLPAPVMQHVVMIGLRNILMDSHASVTAKDNPDDYREKSLAVAEGKLEAMMKGELRSNGTPRTRTLDPVSKEAKALANDVMRKSAGAKWTKGECASAVWGKLVGMFGPAEAHDDATGFLIHCRDAIAASPAIMAQARARVEESKGLGLEGLGL